MNVDMPGSVISVTKGTHGHSLSVNTHIYVTVHTVHYLGKKLCKRPNSSVGRATVRYSEGQRSSPGQAAYFSHPVTYIKANKALSCKLDR
jgi:hypothetical protein